jgi:hypothetical protein
MMPCGGTHAKFLGQIYGEKEGKRKYTKYDVYFHVYSLELRDAIPFFTIHVGWFFFITKCSC